MVYDLSGGRLGRELKTALLGEMRRGVPLEDWDQLRRESTSQILIKYLTWQSRFITAVPRSIQTTGRFELRRSLLPTSEKRRLDLLLVGIADGSDLTHHLSKRAQVAWRKSHPKTPHQHRVDLDLLLFGWGIHHLHLRPGGRSDELLLGIFTDEAALLIDVGDHGSFDDETLVSDAIRARPSLFQPLRGVIGLASDPTGSHAQLRNGGVTTFFEVDGRVYPPPGIGITTARTPMEATRRSNAVMHTLARIIDEPSVALDKLFKASVALPAVHVELQGSEICLSNDLVSIRLT